MVHDQCESGLNTTNNSCIGLGVPKSGVVSNRVQRWPEFDAWRPKKKVRYRYCDTLTWIFVLFLLSFQLPCTKPIELFLSLTLNTIQLTFLPAIEVYSGCSFVQERTLKTTVFGYCSVFVLNISFKQALHVLCSFCKFNMSRWSRTARQELYLAETRLLINLGQHRKIITITYNRINVHTRCRLTQYKTNKTSKQVGHWGSKY